MNTLTLTISSCAAKAPPIRAKCGAGSAPAALAALSLAACCAWTSSAGAAPSAADLATIHTQIEQLRQRNHSAETSRNQVADALAQSERAISATNRTLSELDQEHQKSVQALAQLQKKIDTTHNAISRQQRELAQLLRQQYLSGHADAIKLLLSDEDPNQIARNLTYFAYISRARNRLIAALQQNLNQIGQLSAAEQQQQIQLEQQRLQHQQQRRLLQAQREQKQQVIKKLGSEIQAQRQQIATLEQNERRITRLIEALARAAAQKQAREDAARAAARAKSHRQRIPENNQPQARLAQPRLPDSGLGRLKGHLIFPTHGELIHRYGTPREQGGTLWKGIFIKAPAGQAVHCVANGQVVFADWLRGFGNLIIVDHGGGYMSLYSDNETLYKRVGDYVKAGDVIASVGNTGGSSETGLYFELRYQSQAFDPTDWIAR